MYVYTFSRVYSHIQRFTIKEFPLYCVKCFITWFLSVYIYLYTLIFFVCRHVCLKLADVLKNIYAQEFRTNLNYIINMKYYLF